MSPICNEGRLQWGGWQLLGVCVAKAQAHRMQGRSSESGLLDTQNECCLAMITSTLSCYR